MPELRHRSIAVYRLPPAVLYGSAGIALLLQTFLPLKFPIARLMDFPLIIAIYFSLMRRDKFFGITLGTVLGLMQDALSHGFIGIYGIAKAIIGYLAASASTRIEIEAVVPRALLTAVFVLTHNFTVFAIQRVMVGVAAHFLILDAATAVIVNVALGLIVFQILDRFRRPA
jgi:rod shape-determining protein MreD